MNETLIIFLTCVTFIWGLLGSLYFLISVSENDLPISYDKVLISMILCGPVLWVAFPLYMCVVWIVKGLNSLGVLARLEQFHNWLWK